MSDFEDKLNSILGDSDQMSKIAEMAKSLMGGEKAEETQKAPPDDFLGGLDPGMLGKIGSLLQRSSGKTSEQAALLHAMKPFLSQKRKDKMDKALKIARFAEIAGIAAKEFGGEDDV